MSQPENIHINNPVGRLFTIIHKAKEMVHRNRQSGILWAYVFDISVPEGVSNVPPDAQEEVIVRLFQLRELVREAESALKAINATERFFRPFKALNNLVYVSILSLTNDLSGTLNNITQADLTVLEFGAEKLANERPEAVIDVDELQEIKAMIDALFEEVRRSESIDEELRVFILEQIEIIRRGIAEYWIRGSERIREALAKVGARFLLHPEVAQRADEAGSLTKLRAILMRLSTAAVDTATKKIVEAGIKLLTGDSD